MAYILTKSGNAINSLTIGTTTGNIFIDNNIFNVNDLGNPTGIYYILNLLATGNLTISNNIVTNSSQLTLGAAKNLTLNLCKHNVQQS